MLFDDTGRLLVRAMFWELSTPERRRNVPPIYTLKQEETHGLPSAYKIYIESVDEYDAAIKICGTMKAWRALCEAGWFLSGWREHGHEGLVQWRADMEARDKSQAKQQLLDKAAEGNVAAMTRLYNMAPKKPDNRLKKKEDRNDTQTKVIDLAERMRGK